MVSARKIHSNKIIMILFTLIICFMGVMMPIQEAKAVLPALLLNPAFYGVVATLLVAGGLVFTKHSDAVSTARAFFSQADVTAKQAIEATAYTMVNTKVPIPPSLWQGMTNWINTTFGAGANSYNANLTKVTDNNGNEFPARDIPLQAGTFFIDKSITFNGDSYEFKWDGTYLGGAQNYYFYKNNSKIGSVSYVNNGVAPTNLYLISNSGLGVILCVNYQMSGSSNWTSSQYTIPNTLAIAQGDQPISNTAVSVTGNPDYVDNVARPVPVADSNGNTWIEPLTDVSNKTVADVPLSDVIPVSTGMTTGDKTWWQNIINPITTSLASMLSTVQTVISGKMNDIYTKVGEVVTTLTGTIALALTSIKDAIMSDTATDVLEPALKRFSIPDLFFLFIDILLACIRLVVRATVFTATIVTISASSGMLDGNHIAGLDFMKNQNIPVLNVSLWTCFSSVMTIVIALSIVKKVKNSNMGA